MTKYPHKVVSEHTARNPIARAMAWNKLKQFSTEARAQAYLMTEGETYRDFVVGIAEFLALAQYAMRFDGRSTHPDFLESDQLIAAAMALLIQCSADEFRWKTQYAPTLDHALFHAQEVTKDLTALAVNRAWLAVHDPAKLQRVEKQHLRGKNKR